MRRALSFGLVLGAAARGAEAATPVQKASTRPAAAVATSALSFYTVAPCRLVDTRNAIGPYGGPAVAANSNRTFILAGRCRTSPTAGAISINLTETHPTAAGFITLAPGGSPTRPNTSAMNYKPNQTRANNAIVTTGAGGDVTVWVTQATGSTHVIIDVNGYFDDPSNNQPPIADAGPNQTITLPDSATLTGSGTDDGLPAATLAYSWTKLSGPGTVTFGDATMPATTASFSTAGTYVLQLGVSDSALTDAATLTVSVNPAGYTGSTADIVRFLDQATWGPSDALVAHVQAVGLAAYLNEQFNAPDSGYPTLPLQPTSVPTTCTGTCIRDYYTMYPLQTRFFVNALYGPDQLRQRVAWALHKIMVVSGLDLTLPSWMTPYLRILDRNAFGNFRQLLYEITLNPAMGQYLNMNTNTKNNPNENYAREILQLFTTGTDVLNPDGTPQLDGITGEPLPTYDQSAITALAHVFTGWRNAPDVAVGVPDYITPMVLTATRHDTTAKTLSLAPEGPLTLTAGQTGDQDLNNALDYIYYHPNVGPFIARGLIHDFVTSNPTPAYVARVAAIFDDNGAGIRGDLPAVVLAILLDPEARGDVKADPGYGKLKEPAQYVTNVLRAFDAKAASGAGQSDGYVYRQASPMGQDIFRPPTVFSYFPADFQAPGTSLLGPEFALLSATTALKRANFVNTMVYSTIPVGTNAPNGTSLDLSRLLPLAGNPQQLVDELNRLLLHGSMSTFASSGLNNMNDSVVQAISAISCPAPCSGTNALLRVRQAAYLVATSTQYQVQR